MDVLENGDYKGKKRVVKSKFFVENGHLCRGSYRRWVFNHEIKSSVQPIFHLKMPRQTSAS